MKTAVDRFMDKVWPEALTGCWLWAGHTQYFGYGRVIINYRPYSAHRVSYEMHVGRIPNGAHVLHRCDNPACVAPHHLFLGDQASNMGDMKKKGRGSNQMKGVTHCKNGHEFTPENTYQSSGRRSCKACIFARTAKRRQQLKETK